MKSKEELNELKKEVESVNEKLQELTEEELEQVTGGLAPLLVDEPSVFGSTVDLLKAKNISVIATEIKY
ncbi:MAG: class IIb bacteriocin, lactobin A/cerein 7B family [Prevotellaceae bacterium]|nr:class IIb bacteriocin, lactobin A/cerein 7B family [Candidatus Colivivens equi]